MSIDRTSSVTRSPRAASGGDSHFLSTEEESGISKLAVTPLRCKKLVVLQGRGRTLGEWNTSTAPWDQIVEQGVSEFGMRKRFVELANLAAGIRSRKEKCQDSPDLLDVVRPLVRRARYARLRAGSRMWWSKQLRSATSDDEVWMTLLFFEHGLGPGPSLPRHSMSSFRA